MEYLILHDRKDRLGSNLYFKLSIFLLAKHDKKEIFYLQNIKYPESIFTQVLLTQANEKKTVPENKSTDKNYLNKNKVGLRWYYFELIPKIKQDVISYFRKKYLPHLYPILKEKAVNFPLPSKSNPYIAIHLRLDDTSLRKDYDGRPVSNYIKKILESDIPANNQYNYLTKKKIGKDYQTCIHPHKLEKFLRFFQIKYPNYPIILVTKFYQNYIPPFLIYLKKKYNFQIKSNSNPDIDLWLLIQSQILLLSKSTFSLQAGLYHQGDQVFYPRWGTFTCLGLGTKYDKSNKENWIPYI